MHLPHSLDIEVQKEGPVRRDKEGDRRDTADAGEAHGRGGDRGGNGVRGRHPHLPKGKRSSTVRATS